MTTQTPTAAAPLYDSVVQFFIQFSAPHEGICDHMYPDKDNAITTMIGYLIDSPAAAEALPWYAPSGQLATAQEIRTEWHALKAADLRAIPAAKMRSQTTLRLRPDDIVKYTLERLQQMARQVAHQMPQFLQFPADAQMAVMSMCWALGVGRFFGLFVKCVGHLQQFDYAAAATECKMDETNNAGIINRNIENARFLHAAEKVKLSGADPSKLTPLRPRRPSVNTVAGQQAALNLLGYDAGAEDGAWGPKTAGALKRFQGDQKLEPDGIAGPKTLRALGAALAKLEG